MSTKTGILRRMMLSGVAGLCAVTGLAAGARADVASDKAGAIVIFPKIVVDTSGVLGPPTDTEVQLTNTSNREISARCFIVDATSHCSNAPTVACTVEGVAAGRTAGAGGCTTGGTCVAGWKENDFQLTLTKRQPIAWRASGGLPNLPIDPQSLPDGESNVGSSIPPAQEDPFVGEIKCVETDANFAPSIGVDPINNFTGDLKGEATIISATGEEATIPSRVDARKYNAVGLQATSLNNGDDRLQLGPSGPANVPLCAGGSNAGNPCGSDGDCPGGGCSEYNGCPSILILDNYFDGAVVATHEGARRSTITTDLTVVPCGEDFAIQQPNSVVLQFLVFNEFEQRFSTSTSVTCFREVQLSNIDTRATATDNSSSIFNVNVQGTLTGQTRIRPVASQTAANAVVGIAEEFWQCAGGACTAGPNNTTSDAVNLHFTGSRFSGDEIILSPDVTAP